jgi:hypothetical protein
VRCSRSFKKYLFHKKGVFVMTGQNQNLARQEIACEQKQQPMVIDRNEAARQKALMLVPKSATVSVLKVGKKYHLHNGFTLEGFIEVFEVFEEVEKNEDGAENVSVPYVWVRFLSREHYGEVKQLKYITRSGVPGWRYVVRPTHISKDCKCVTCDAVISFS